MINTYSILLLLFLVQVQGGTREAERALHWVPNCQGGSQAVMGCTSHVAAEWPHLQEGVQRLKGPHPHASGCNVTAGSQGVPDTCQWCWLPPLPSPVDVSAWPEWCDACEESLWPTEWCTYVWRFGILLMLLVHFSSVTNVWSLDHFLLQSHLFHSWYYL